jgi:hypothetical protein
MLYGHQGVRAAKSASGRCIGTSRTYALRVRSGPMVAMVLVLVDLLLRSAGVRGCSWAWLPGWLLICAFARHGAPISSPGVIRT